MDERDFRDPVPTGDAFAPSHRSARSMYPPPSSGESSESVSRYIQGSMDYEGLTEDIQAIVEKRIQMSIPDEQKLLLDLNAQVSDLRAEVRQLRRQLEGKPYAMFNCPSGQMREMSEEITQIRRMLENGSDHRRNEPLLQEPIYTPLTERSHPRTEHEMEPDVEFEEPEVEDGLIEQGTEPPPAPARGKVKKKPTAMTIIGNVLFYAMIVGLIFGAFLFKSGSGGQPTMIAGYSAFTVLTSSMEDTYPKGSLILTKQTDAKDLQIGDDITYMVSETSSITHRIIGIMEDYMDTGSRAFETKGTMNEKPDKEPVAAANVVGKVIFCSKALGWLAAFVSDNWPILLFAAAVVTGLIVFLRWNFRREEQKNARQPQPHGQ